MSTSTIQNSPTGQSMLIATLFAQQTKNKSTIIDTPISVSISQGNDLTAILLSILPPKTLTHSTTRQLSPRVVQQTYTNTSSDLNPSSLRHHPSFQSFETTHSLELVLHVLPTPQPTPYPLELAVFDMDSTLINQEVIDELARTIGMSDLVSAITERAMAGELDFAASLTERVALLKGVKTDVWKDLKGVITFSNGARELCRALKKLGVKMAVLSGGFQPMAEWAKEELGLDYAYANHLLTSPPTPTHPYPHLTGRLSPSSSHPMVTAAMKRTLLLTLASTATTTSIADPISNDNAHSVPPIPSTLCVGDGANDLEMLSAAGLGVAFRAKEKVQRVAPNRLNSASMVDLLYLYGWDEGEVRDLCAAEG